MDRLPASIASYLNEAGFSSTEILILNRLLEEDALTLRELAAKTGKSTGVLDQAMKKLLRRNIVEKPMINDTPKYMLSSLQSIIDWMEDDTQTKREQLERRYINFETFITSLEKGKSRPHIEHFEGLSGIQSAYEKLLQYGAKEVLGYVPVQFKEEEDPLRDFKVGWFRERYKKGVFLRILAHDTPLGRRFQGRDAFEYRKSILIDPERYPFNVEKYIVNGVVACIDYNKRSAVFLHYPEMAASERDMFDRLWKKKMTTKQAGDMRPNPHFLALKEILDKPIPPYTRVISLLRDFLVGPKSLVAMGFCAMLAAGLSYAIYLGDAHLNTERIRDKVTAIASTATVEFTADELNQFHTKEDGANPLYNDIVKRLQQIRRRNSEIVYAYILRPNDKNTHFEFIADADSPFPFELKDYNGDGKVDSEDDPSPPGRPIDVNYIDVLAAHNYQNPIATYKPYTDQWGTVFSGYAPIRDANNHIVALLAIDMTAQSLRNFTNETYSPIFCFFCLFVLFILFRLAAFNRPILKELLRVVDVRRLIAWSIVFSMFTVALLSCLYLYALKSVKEEIGNKAMSIAATAALQIDAKDLEPLQQKEDMHRPEYQKVFNQINEVRNQNTDIEYIYIFRPTNKEGIWDFVVDGDSNYDLTSYADINSDGKINEEDATVWPGVHYDIKSSSPKTFVLGLKQPLYEISQVGDQWGKFISGFAPIKDKNGKAVAVLGVDFNLDDVYQMIFQRFLSFAGLPIFLMAILALYLFYFNLADGFSLTKMDNHQKTKD